ncbi:hypothetical protein DERP_002867 [Dermatophagoides pteronyssinus]|uniref:Uncharacterized protein n=1 Tax=Dermatophagoides pteronyssinus TaxID=6956 RepID=A0ABQ8JW07_DERPT|nr:hypothetical protein DERP_002867 [Dermatophagoides pteronyssinus]
MKSMVEIRYLTYFNNDFDQYLVQSKSILSSGGGKKVLYEYTKFSSIVQLYEKPSKQNSQEPQTISISGHENE